MESCNWNGHKFDVHNPNVIWNDVPGLYIFAGLAANGNWNAYYVGICKSFKVRLLKHEQWRAAVRLGATHVHSLVVPEEADRLGIEQSLIDSAQPPLNIHHR